MLPLAALNRHILAGDALIRHRIRRTMTRRQRRLFRGAIDGNLRLVITTAARAASEWGIERVVTVFGAAVRQRSRLVRDAVEVDIRERFETIRTVYVLRSATLAQVLVALAVGEKAGTLLRVALAATLAAEEPIRARRGTLAEFLAEIARLSAVTHLVTGRIGMITGVIELIMVSFITEGTMVDDFSTIA